jgi:hypothetical protein
MHTHEGKAFEEHRVQKIHQLLRIFNVTSWPALCPPDWPLSD